MRKLYILFSVICLMVLTSCGKSDSLQSYDVNIMDTFDTNINIVVYDNDKKKAMDTLESLRNEFSRLNDIFDCHKSYPGVVNVKSINEKAGIEPVKVSRELYDLIRFSVDSYYNISRKNNVAMGPVIDLWNSYRTLYNEGCSPGEVAEKLGSELPTEESLEALRPLINMDNVVLNDSDCSVFLKLKGMKLDLGSVAKGYAVEIVAKKAADLGVEHGIINAGGNVKVIGKPADGRDYFNIAIESPYTKDEEFLTTLGVADSSVVTSSDHQRFFTYDGKVYCHIIDPDTLWPGDVNKSVTVIAKDSGLCDFMSTALYLLPYNDGMSLVKKTGTEAVWALPDGSVIFSDGAKGMVVNK